jgi:asparagine synthase (glutamine-hydrolysing)
MTPIVWSYGIHSLIPEAVKAFRRRLYGVSNAQFLLGDSPISRACAERTGVVERLQLALRRAQLDRTARAQHGNAVLEGSNPLILEWYNTLGLTHGIEERYPFFDRRMVELCVSLPPELKLQQGWTRYILRRAMEGILPPAIQWRSDKTDTSSYLHYSICKEGYQQLLATLSAHEDQLANYIDIQAVRERLTSCMAGQAITWQQWMPVWLTLTLASWLNQQEQARELSG